jgi:hypothetical protein
MHSTPQTSVNALQDSLVKCVNQLIAAWLKIAPIMENVLSRMFANATKNSPGRLALT